MSPAKQNSKERQAARDRRALARQVSPSGNIGANAYNPASGTFHTLESIPSDLSTGYVNGRFKTFDETDDPNGGGTEIECMSNNDSCSGESEDQPHANGKEKNLVGKLVGGGTDKRDKIRGKNERKHQRQRERRAQDLRDKCTGYLMSRKLEVLSQQLVAMGFFQERATMALIFNDGHVEQSVAWLLEGGEGQVAEDWSAGGNPKIDISEELGQIADIEKKYRFPRPEIERAIVSFEGDLDKALSFLRVKAENTSSTPESEKVQSGLKEVSAATKELRPPATPALQDSGPLAQQRVRNGLQPVHQARKDIKGLIYLKTQQQTSMTNPHTSDVSNKCLSHANKPSNTGTDLHRSFPAADNTKLLPKLTTVFHKTSPTYMHLLHSTSISRPDASGIININGPDPVVVSTPGKEYFVDFSAKNVSGTGLSPPVLSPSELLQVSAAGTTCSISSSSNLPPKWNCGFVDMVSPSSSLFDNSMPGEFRLTIPVVAKKAVETQSTTGCFSTVASTQSDTQWPSVDNAVLPQNTCGSTSSPAHSMSHSRSSSLTSYRLFTGWGSAGTSSSVDWNTGPMVHCDYRNIDWSMSISPSTTTEKGGKSMQGLSASLNSSKLQEKGSGWSSEEEVLGNTHFIMESMTTTTINAGGIWNGRLPSSGGVSVQNNVQHESLGSTAAFGVYEWTSPFAGKDLFKLPQAVPSPLL